MQDDDRLYRSPRNALQPVAMHRKDGDSHRYLVIAQLDWGHRTPQRIIRP